MKLKILFTILVLFLTFSLAQAEITVIQIPSPDQAFSIGATIQNPSVCSCAGLVDNIVITNTGIYTSSYEITTNSPYAQEVMPVVLRGGETTTISIMHSVPCETRAQTLDYNVNVKNTFGGEKQISRSLTINQCKSIGATITGPKEVLPCEPVTFNINVTNTAPFFEDFYVSTISYENYFKEKIHLVSLDSGQTGFVQKEMTLSCDLFGKKEVEFEIFAQRSNMEAFFTHEMEVKKDYDFSISFDPQEPLCKKDTREIPITITNEGSVDNVYNLFLNDRRAYLLHNELEIAAGESAQTTIVLTRHHRVLENELLLTVDSKFGDMRVQERIPYQTISCFELETELWIEDFSNSCTGEITVPFVIRNNAPNKKLTEVEAILYFQNEIIKRSHDLYDEVIDEVTFTVEDFNAIRNIPVIIEVYGPELVIDRKTITFHGKSYCDRLAVQNNRISNLYNESTLNITLINRGIIDQNYTIYTENYPVNFTQEIFLEKGQSKSIFLPQNKTLEDVGRHNFNLIAESDKATYSFTITHIVREDTALNRFLSFLLNLWWLWLLLLLLLLLWLLIRLILFLIRTLTWEFTFFKWFLVIFVIILILIAIIAFLNAVAIRGEFNVNGMPLIVMHTNDEFNLNLSNHFIDPDGGPLRYEIGLPPSLVNAKINQEMLTLKSSNETINTNFTIIAYDMLEDFTESPVYELEVRQPIDYAFAKTNWFRILLILIIIAVILFVLPNKVRPRKKNKK